MKDEIKLKKGDVVVLYKWEAALKRWKKHGEGYGLDMSYVHDILGIKKRIYDTISDKETIIIVYSDDLLYPLCRVMSKKLLNLDDWALPKCVIKKVGVNVYENR